MDPDLANALQEARCARPFDVLGLHPASDGAGPGWVVRVWAPWAMAPRVCRPDAPDVSMAPAGDGLWEARFPEADGPFSYRLAAEDPTGRSVSWEDP